MQVRVPEVDIQGVGLTTISVGQIAIGPITVGELVLNNADFSLSGAHGKLQNVSVTVKLHITFSWHIHIGLPWPLSDIDIGSTFDLGTITFSMNAGDIVLPVLSNIHIHIPSLTALNMSVSANPLTNLQLQNAAAERIRAQNVALPSGGFTVGGLTLNSVQGSAISVPAAKLDQATVGHLHGDPVRIPAFALGGLNLPVVQIPDISSSAPLDIPADLLSQTVSFDAGILRAGITITPSALSHIDHLEIFGASANASVGQVVLHNVVLPYDVLNLTLAQVGINTIVILPVSSRK
jgi:hypothetical protein